MNINQCPHCNALPPSDANHLETAFWQMRHLLDHALLGVSSLTLEELPDMSYYDYVEGRTNEQHPWQTAVRNAVECLVNEMFHTLADYQSCASALAERGALGVCKPDTAPYANNWGKGMYLWLREHYSADVDPWNDQLERTCRGG